MNYFLLNLILNVLLLSPIRWLWSDWGPYCSWLAEEVNPWCHIIFSYRGRYSLHKLWLFDRSSLPPDTFDFCSDCCLTIWNILCFLIFMRSVCRKSIFPILPKPYFSVVMWMLLRKFMFSFWVLVLFSISMGHRIELQYFLEVLLALLTQSLHVLKWFQK